MTVRLFPSTCLLALLLSISCLPALAEIPLFDSHSHYKSEDAAAYSPAEVVTILDREKIQRMLVIGEPAGLVQSLYQYAPERFVPFLGLYQNYKNKADWMFDLSLPGRLRQQLSAGHYQGIGEIHLFAPQKRNPVFKQILKLADEFQLPILLHGDAEVVEQVYSWFPTMTVIWAHLGTRPEPELIDQMLKRYPETLFIDTSVRDERFLDNDVFKPQWYSLFIRHADRLLVGIDTYRLQRWHDIGLVTRLIRQWLAQLPDDVARKIAHQNAHELFNSNQVIGKK